MAVSEIKLKSSGDFHRSPLFEKEGQGEICSEAIASQNKRNPPQSPFAKGAGNSTHVNPTCRIYFEMVPVPSIALQRDFYLAVVSVSGNERRGDFWVECGRGLSRNFCTRNNSAGYVYG